MPELRGQRIILRDMVVDDLDAFAYWMHPDHAWQKLDGPYYEKSTVEQIQQQVEHLRVRLENKDFPTPRTRLVIADRADNAMLGMVTRYWISEETDWLAQGIVLYDPARWGLGLGFEAFGLWSQYLLDAMPHIVRLDLRTWSGNLGMMKLALKLGYQQEACFRKARIVDGQYYDGLGYGILREEWDALYPHGFAAALENQKRP